MRAARAILVFFGAFLIYHLIGCNFFPVDENNVLQAPNWYPIVGFAISGSVAYLSTKGKSKPNRTNIHSPQKAETYDISPSQRPQGHIYEVQKKSVYNIIIFRKWQIQSSAKKYKVFLDGTPSGILRNGKSVSIPTTPGEHRIDFKGYTKIETSISIRIPEGHKTTSIYTQISLVTGKIFPEHIESNGKTVTPDPKVQSHPKTLEKHSPRTVSLARIDRMEGHEFEHFTADLLRKLGYERVEVTPGSGDQGVDVIAVKDGKRYAIQCKRYSQKLGNKPVQEVFAGKTIYGCSVAVVLTNNYFTDGAKEAAKATGVELWDRDALRRMLDYANYKTIV